MADIFRTTNKRREDADDMPSPALAKPLPKPPVEFIRGFTPEERKRQAEKLQEMLRNRQP